MTPTILNAGKDAEKVDAHIASGNIKWYSHSGKQQQVLTVSKNKTHERLNSNCIYHREMKTCTQTKLVRYCS
jgi:hypothetical protein